MADNPTMNRRHFQLIADTLGTIDGDSVPGLTIGQFSEICHLFADSLGDTNHLFDRVKFLEACGLTDEDVKPKLKRGKKNDDPQTDDQA